MIDRNYTLELVGGGFGLAGFVVALRAVYNFFNGTFDEFSMFKGLIVAFVLLMVGCIISEFQKEEKS